MRKKLLIAAAIILLLLLSFIGMLQYRQYSSYKVPVHAGAQTIIKINVDDFIKIFLRNYGLDFKKKITKKDKQEKETSLNTGIWLSGNIFIYNISSLGPGNLFCTLPMYDLQDFLIFAKEKWKLTFVETAGIYYGSNAAGSFTAACNKDYISLAWSPSKEKVEPFLKEILSSKYLPEQHPALAALLKKQRLPVVAVNGANLASLNFDDNELLLQASIDSIPGIIISANFQDRKHAADTHSYLSFNGQLATSLFKKEYSIKQYKLETDSILPHFKDYLDVELGPNSTQKDSISTYEYDDNFEKITKLTVTDVQVPSLQVSLKAGPGLLEYLQRQQIVSSDMQLNREVFPLYQVRVLNLKNLLQFSTSGQESNQTFRSADHFLDLHLDVAKTAAQLNLPFLDVYIKNLLQVDMQGSRKENKLVLEGKFIFKGSAVKEIIDLVKNL